MLLLVIMTIAWFITALLIWGLVKNVTFLEALCISSAVTPTDPVLANSITSGQYDEEHVPENVRHIILAESGANDGLGFPFMFLAVVLLVRTGMDKGTSVGEEIWRWFYGVIVYDFFCRLHMALWSAISHENHCAGLLSTSSLTCRTFSVMASA